MKTFYQNQRSKLYNKYSDLNNRLRKAVKNGQFYKYSIKKQHQLARILQRYQKQLQKAGIAVSASVLLSLPSVGLQAQSPVMNGSRIQVNGNLGSNGSPTAAMDNDGDFAVVWMAEDTISYSDFSTFLQRYDSSGTAQGSITRVSLEANYEGVMPQVAMDDDGDIVVVFEYYDYVALSSDLYYQRYDNNGTAVGGPTKINQNTDLANFYVGSTVAMDDDGDFVVAWNVHAIENGLDVFKVYMRSFDNTGTPLNNETQVNTTTDRCKFVDAAMDDDGDFAVVWGSYNNSGSQINVRRYDNTATALGNEVVVTTPNELNPPAIAMDDDGDFVVVWNDYDLVTDYYDVYFQRYSAAGNASGSTVQVTSNANKSHLSYDASVDMDMSGNFVVVWEEYDYANDLYGVYGQAYNSVGTPLNGEFLVDTVDASSAFLSARGLAMSDNGDFVVPWLNAASKSENDVYVQRFTGNLPTSTKNEVVNLAVSIFPNPTTEVLNFETEENGFVQITNILGQPLKEVKINNSNTPISVKDLPTGTYFLLFTNEKGQRANMKFVKE